MEEKMKCRHFSFFVLVLFLSFFFGFFITTNSYASSVTCTGSISNMSTGVSLASNCDTSVLDQSVRWYYSFSVTNSPNFTSYKNNARLCFIPQSNYSCSSSATSNGSNYVIPIDNYRLSSSITPFLFLDDSSQRLLYLGSYNFSSTFSGSINYNFLISDVAPFDTSICPSSPSGELEITENGTYDVLSYATATVDVPAEVIQGDYHDDLVNIQKSIIICGAILLVLYFFYCIYRLIIKNSGVH